MGQHTTQGTISFSLQFVNKITKTSLSSVGMKQTEIIYDYLYCTSNAIRLSVFPPSPKVRFLITPPTLHV